MELQANSEGKRGLVKLYRAFEPLFTFDYKPVEPLIAREVAIHVSEAHADFSRLRRYLGEILGYQKARRTHYIKAEFVSGELSSSYNVSFSV